MRGAFPPDPGRGFPRLATAVLLGEAALLALCLLHSAWCAASAAPRRERTARLAASLMLTDPALWTDARYARNPALADDFAPFSEYPGAMEHRPAGSVAGPPPSR